VRILVDTHVLIWALMEPGRLSLEVSGQLTSRSNDVMFSAVSIWEIAIKTALGRTDFRVSPRQIAAEAVRVGFSELPLVSDAAAQVADLPIVHRDPFDRLLVVQALAEGARLFTADAELQPYSELIHII
jgi:PIN domain nuclease of toxin-antitoxin system